MSELARQLLPDMPAQVFDAWLLPFVEVRGWPFRSLADSSKGTSFEGVLWGKKLSYWSNLQWVPLRVSHREVSLDPRSKELAEAIVGHVLGIEKMPGPTEFIDDRFGRALRFIDEHHRLPGSVVAVVQNDASWRLADGHHRFAALIFRDKEKVLPVHCWVGWRP